MNTILLVLAGLTLFLYALNKLSQGLSDLSGDKMKSFLDKLQISGQLFHRRFLR
jgi:Na+/phosphate symporter